MGDDIDPHEETMDVPAELPLADVVASLLERRFLMFRYWMQRDPEFVFTELAAGREPRR
jgi:hypothetical protein